MTISTPAAPLSYAGNDSTTAFAVTWAYIAKAHIVATIRDTGGAEIVQVLVDDYTLTAPNTSGTLTMIVAPATGETLVITLEPPNTQETDIPLGGSFPAKSVEDALDVGVQVSQKIENLFDRSLRVPKTDTVIGTDLEMPNETDRAGKFLAFGGDGKPVATAVAPVGGAIISAFAETYLDELNASDTRGVLGAVGLTGNETIAGDKTLSGNNTHSGNNTLSGTNTHSGVNNFTNNVDFTGVVEFIGATPIVLQGATDHATNKTVIVVADPTAANQIDIPDLPVIRMWNLPPGVTVPYAGATIPTGWLECDGSAVSRTTFAALFAAIGTIWGVGDGSSTFNLPNMDGRVAIGEGGRSVGDTGGSDTQTLSTANLASHAHTGRNAVGFADAGIFAVSTGAGNTGSTGSGTAHNNMQTYAVTKYMISY